MRLDIEVGQRIKAAREVMFLSLDEFARIISIETKILQEIEAGKRRPSPTLLLQIAETLSIPVSFLFGQKYSHAINEK